MASQRRRQLQLRDLKHWYKPTKEGEAAREALWHEHEVYFKKLRHSK